MAAICLGLNVIMTPVCTPNRHSIYNMPMKVRYGPWGVFCEFLVWSVIMTSSSGNIFCITGPLCREFTWRSFFLIHRGVHFQVWLLMSVTFWKELSVRASSRYWWQHLPCPPVLICQHVVSLWGHPHFMAPSLMLWLTNKWLVELEGKELTLVVSDVFNHDI